MKNFFKVFVISFSFFLLAMAMGAYSYLKINNIKLENRIGGGFYERSDTDISEKEELENKKSQIKSYNNLKDAIKNSNRINFLILGTEEFRTDTIILASFCEDTKKVNLIHIPRDTYIIRQGYKRADQQKINSVYGTNGILVLQDTISYILNDLPIHHYLTIDYKAVENIVNQIGGVRVDVPFKMTYKDLSAKPPLIIDIPAGNQLLDGEKSLQFLRYRKGTNNEGYVDGDLGRIKAQQRFLQSFIDKAMDNRVKIIREGFKHVKTDIGLLSAFSYARKANGITMDNVEIDILPGESEFKAINGKVLSYYIKNDEETTKLLNRIYNVQEK